MHQRIISLPGSHQVNIPERLEGGVEGIGRFLVTTDKLALEKLNRLFPAHPGRVLFEGAFPVHRDLVKAGLKLILNAKGRRGDIVCRPAIHAVGEPHAAISAVGRVGHTIISALGENLRQVLEIIIGKVHIIHNPPCPVIHQRKPQPGFDSHAPLGDIEVGGTNRAFERAGQGHETIRRRSSIRHLGQENDVGRQGNLKRCLGRFRSITRP